MSDKYTVKPTWEIQSSETTALHVASIFSDLYVVLYRTRFSGHIKRPTVREQNVSRHYSFLWVNLLPTTEYHLKTNGQAEHYNKPIVPRLHHYVTERQREWDLFCTAANVQLQYAGGPLDGKNLVWPDALTGTTWNNFIR